MLGHVLNTRPADRAAALTTHLRQVGYQVSELPLLAFERCLLSCSDQQALQQIAIQSVVVVISPIAAQLGLAQVAQFGINVADLPIRWIAVGQATAQVLRQSGLSPTVPTLETSEGVVALPEIEQLAAGQRVMVWRGKAGRELIQLQLQQQQVYLSNLELYRRVSPPRLVEDWSVILQQVGWPDVVLISSAEAWRQWQALTQTEANNAGLLVLGQRLFQQLQPLTARLLRVPDLQPLTIGQALQEIAI